MHVSSLLQDDSSSMIKYMAKLN